MPTVTTPPPPQAASIVSRLTKGRLQSCMPTVSSAAPLSRPSLAAGSGGGEASKDEREGWRGRGDSAEVASLAASAAINGGLAQSAMARRGHRARHQNRRGSVDDMAIGSSLVTAQADATDADAKDGAATRAKRLEAAELRRQLHVALTENEAMRGRLRVAEAALQQSTSEVI